MSSEEHGQWRISVIDQHLSEVDGRYFQISSVDELPGTTAGRARTSSRTKLWRVPDQCCFLPESVNIFLVVTLREHNCTYQLTLSAPLSADASCGETLLAFAEATASLIFPFRS